MGVWRRDPVGIFLSLFLIAAGLGIATIALSAFGVDLQFVEQPPEYDSWWWWVTSAPQFYPSQFLTLAFALMLFVFRVYMRV